MRKYSLILSLVLSCSFSLQAQNLPLYSSPFEIKLTNAIATWTSDFGVRTQAITNNSFPSLSLWNSFNYNLGYPGSYGPLDPELFATSSNDILNTNIIQQLRFDRGPASFDVPLNELPRGVAPLSWMQQRLLAAAKGLISTHYQHTHLPGFNPANVTPSTNYSWSPVSDNPLLQTSQELIQGTTSTVVNPYTNYGTPQPGMDCTDFSSYLYNLALGIQMYSGTATQVQFINPDTNPDSFVTNSFIGTNSIPTATILGSDGTVITPNFLLSPNFGTPLFNAPGSLNDVISQLRPGDLLYMRGEPTNISHVVVWLGKFGVNKNGTPSTVPLIISSHDNTPAIFNTTNINTITGLPKKFLCNNITTFLPPPGVQILPFTPETWFYQNFSLAMQVLPLSYPGNYGLSKTVNYAQSSSQSPTLEPYLGYQFQAFVNPLTNVDLLPLSQIATPAENTGIVDFQSGQFGLFFSENFPTSAALNTAFPAGNYSLVIQTTDSNNYISPVTFNSATYPSVPKIVRLTNALWTNGYLMIPDPLQPVTLSWSPFKSAHGSINFNIQGSGGFNGYYTNFPATGLVNSLTIPGGTLPRNSTIQGTLGFSISPNGYFDANYQIQNSFFLLTETNIPSSQNPYVIQKQHILEQNSTNPPAEMINNSSVETAPYNFSIQSPISGSVKGPGGKYPPRFTTQYSGAAYAFQSPTFATIGKLNSAFPDGNYKLSTGQNLMLSNSIYPNASNPPQILQVNGETPTWNAQGELVLDPSIVNTLTWTPYSGTNSSYNFASGGYEEFQMQNNNGGGFATNEIGGPFAGTSEPFNQLTVPAESLTPNETYSVSINYSLASSVNTNGGFAAAIYSTKTTFTAVASPTPSPTP